MDSATATVLDGQQLFAFVASVMWVLLRVGGLMAVAPLYGSRAVPKRIKVLMAGALSVAILPLLPAPPAGDLDATSLLTAARELALGAMMGFVLKLAFEAGAIAGELISQGTGLSFATLADPLRGQNSPVLGQFFYLAFGLLFFAFDGHLAIVEMLVRSYQTMPIGASLPDAAGALSALQQFFAYVMRAGVLLALPVVAAMLAVNLAFGVLGRAAAALNPIALGLPTALLVGLLLLIPLVGRLAAPVQVIFDNAFTTATGLAD